jgi:uncharacterized protein involved in exopolysaccharide biosynthesis
MNGERNTYEDDEIDLRDLVRKTIDFAKHVWKEQRYVWYALLITVPIGLLVAFGSQEEYTAHTKILPYRSGGSTLGGLSGLAGLAGIQLPSGSSGQIISTEMYPELTATLDFRMRLAETPIRFGSLNKTITPLEYFRDYTKPTALEIVKSNTIGLPSKLVGKMITLVVHEKDAISVEAEHMDSPRINVLKQYDAAYLSEIQAIGNRISLQNRNIIIIEATMPDPVAAADLVRAFSENLVESVISYEVNKTKEEILFLEENYKKSQSRFMNAQLALAIFTDKNRETQSATAQIEAQRLQSEYGIAAQIYGNFSTQLEQARIQLNRDTPIFTVLESVTIPNNKSAPRRGRVLLFSLLIGVFIGIAIITVRQIKKNFNTSNNSIIA